MDPEGRALLKVAASKKIKEALKEIWQGEYWVPLCATLGTCPEETSIYEEYTIVRVAE